MKKTSICFSDIHPFVRYVQNLRIVREVYPACSNVVPYDARIFYVHSGKGTLHIDGEEFALSRGQAMLWMAGVNYLIRSDDEINDPLILLGCNFDFIQADRQYTTPIPPEPTDTFDPSRVRADVEITDFPRMNKPVIIGNMQSIEEPLLRMVREYKTQKLFFSEKLSSILSEIIVSIGRRVVLYDSDNGMSAEQGDRIIAYIHEHYAKALDNKRLGQIFGYHPNHLNRIMKRYTGRTLHQYLCRYRIACAVDMLLATTMPIAEIATGVGFYDASHFSNAFKRIMGCAPGELRGGLSPLASAAAIKKDESTTP